MDLANDNLEKRRPRLRPLVTTTLLMGLSFAAGVTVTAVIAVALLLPIATTSFTIGMVGLASASTNATINGLYSGDSEMRLTVLKQIKESFVTQPPQKFDSQMVAWILPAIESCKTDKNPKVVELAIEIANYLKNDTLPQPKS